MVLGLPPSGTDEVDDFLARQIQVQTIHIQRGLLTGLRAQHEDFAISATNAHGYNTVTFDPIRTTAIRMNVKFAKDGAPGILAWKVSGAGEAGAL